MDNKVVCISSSSSDEEDSMTSPPLFTLPLRKETPLTTTATTVRKKINRKITESFLPLIRTTPSSDSVLAESSSDVDNSIATSTSSSRKKHFTFRKITPTDRESFSHIRSLDNELDSPVVESDFQNPFEEDNTPTTSKNGRLVYLVTYPQAKSIGREQFANIVVSAFNAVKDDDVVQQWACCLEHHVVEGFHYHVAIKLKKKRRWADVGKYIRKNNGIVVHFRTWLTFYYDCFTYVTKEDRE